MAGTLFQILTNKADLEGGKLKTSQIPDGIGGITLNDVKADPDIASALSLKHSNSTDHAAGSDNQDLSAFESHITTPHLQFTGLAKITVSTTQPTDPDTGDLWIDTN